MARIVWCSVRVSQAANPYIHQIVWGDKMDETIEQVIRQYDIDRKIIDIVYYKELTRMTTSYPQLSDDYRIRQAIDKTKSILKEYEREFRKVTIK